ncbi:precorrin-6y C5,15-methyltransferase (decarboxylating), CbiE subunit [Candidatus Magnetoovum chiemensis]|nr:precorrin-6y C5,15-methyltransferase (decarboxylating), CbiE subunit [Candidatus Magnetoovum chiemensis]
MHKITVIGAGPGAAQYLTLYALDKVKTCDVVIGTKEQLLSINTNSSQIVYEQNKIEKIFDLIKTHEGQEIAVMVTGDPGIYSLAQKIGDKFGKEAIKELIPGISSIQLAFAKIKESWLNVSVFSYHGRKIENLDKVLETSKAVILCDRHNNSKEILRLLLNLGLLKQHPDIYVCQDLSYETEKVIRIAAKEDIEHITAARREMIVIINYNNR